MDEDLLGGAGSYKNDLSERNSRSAVSSQVLDYYRRFGRQRDLEQYFSLSTAQGELRDPSGLFWRRMKDLSDSSDSGGKKSSPSEVTELCRISITCAPDPSSSSQEGTSSQEIQPHSESPPIVVEENLPDIHEDSDNELNTKSETEGSQKSPEVNLDSSLLKPSSPTSSVTSQRKLEWDSLADVGYGNENSNRATSSNLSTLERLALHQQYSNNDNIRLDDNIGFPTHQSTPLDAETKGKPSKKVKGSNYTKTTRIHKKDIDILELSIDPQSDQNRPINVNLTKHISFNVDPNRNLEVKGYNYDKEIIVSPVEPVPEIKSVCELNDKSIQTTLVKDSSVNTDSKQEIKKIIQQPIPLILNIAPMKKITYRKNRVKKRSKSVKSSKSTDRLRHEEKLDNTNDGGHVSEADSFEYMPGHVFNQSRHSTPKEEKTKTSTESSSAATTDSSKKSTESFTKDLEASIALLKNLTVNRQADANLKKRVIKEIVQKLVKHKYKGDDSPTDLLSGLTFDSDLLTTQNKSYSTTSTSEDSKSSFPKKSILRSSKFTASIAPSTSQSAPNLTLTKKPSQKNTFKNSTCYSNTDSDISSKTQTTPEGSLKKTTSEELYQKYLAAFKQEQKHKEQLQHKQNVFKKKLINNVVCNETPLSSQYSSQPNIRKPSLKKLLEELAKTDFCNEGGDGQKNLKGTDLSSDHKHDNKITRNYSVFTLASDNPTNINNESQTNQNQSSQTRPSQRSIQRYTENIRPESENGSHFCCCPYHSENKTNEGDQIGSRFVDEVTNSQTNSNIDENLVVENLVAMNEPTSLEKCNFICFCCDNDKFLPNINEKFLVFKCCKVPESLLNKKESTQNVSVQCDDQENNSHSKYRTLQTQTLNENIQKVPLDQKTNLARAETCQGECLGETQSTSNLSALAQRILSQDLQLAQTKINQNSTLASAQKVLRTEVLQALAQIKKKDNIALPQSYTSCESCKKKSQDYQSPHTEIKSYENKDLAAVATQSDQPADLSLFCKSCDRSTQNNPLSPTQIKSNIVNQTPTESLQSLPLAKKQSVHKNCKKSTQDSIAISGATKYDQEIYSALTWTQPSHSTHLSSSAQIYTDEKICKKSTQSNSFRPKTLTLSAQTHYNQDHPRAQIQSTEESYLTSAESQSITKSCTRHTQNDCNRRTMAPTQSIILEDSKEDIGDKHQHKNLQKYDYQVAHCSKDCDNPNIIIQQDEVTRNNATRKSQEIKPTKTEEILKDTIQNTIESIPKENIEKEIAIQSRKPSVFSETKTIQTYVSIDPSIPEPTIADINILSRTTSSKTSRSSRRGSNESHKNQPRKHHICTCNPCECTTISDCGDACSGTDFNNQEEVFYDSESSIRNKNKTERQLETHHVLKDVMNVKKPLSYCQSTSTERSSVEDYDVQVKQSVADTAVNTDAIRYSEAATSATSLIQDLATSCKQTATVALSPIVSPDASGELSEHQKKDSTLPSEEKLNTTAVSKEAYSKCSQKSLMSGFQFGKDTAQESSQELQQPFESRTAKQLWSISKERYMQFARKSCISNVKGRKEIRQKPDPLKGIEDANLLCMPALQTVLGLKENQKTNVNLQTEISKESEKDVLDIEYNSEESRIKINENIALANKIDITDKTDKSLYQVADPKNFITTGCTYKLVIDDDDGKKVKITDVKVFGSSLTPNITENSSESSMKKDPIMSAIKDIIKRYTKSSKTVKLDKTDKRNCYKEIMDTLKYLLDTDDSKQTEPPYENTAYINEPYDDRHASYHSAEHDFKNMRDQENPINIRDQEKYTRTHEYNRNMNEQDKYIPDNTNCRFLSDQENREKNYVDINSNRQSPLYYYTTEDQVFKKPKAKRAEGSKSSTLHPIVQDKSRPKSNVNRPESDTSLLGETPETSDSHARHLIKRIKKECERYQQKGLCPCCRHSKKYSEPSSSTTIGEHHMKCRCCKCMTFHHDKNKKSIAYNLILKSTDSVKNDLPKSQPKIPLKNVVVKIPKNRNGLEGYFKIESCHESRIPDKQCLKNKDSQTNYDQQNHRNGLQDVDQPSTSQIASETNPVSEQNMENYTVQEYLERNRPDFVNKASERQDCLKVIHETRSWQRSLQRELVSRHVENVPRLASLSETELRQMAQEFGLHLRDRLPEPKFIKEHEMKKHSEKIYKTLPEVVQKKENLKKQRIKKTNLVMANIFRKNLQRKTLKGVVDISNYSMTIKL